MRRPGYAFLISSWIVFCSTSCEKGSNPPLVPQPTSLPAERERPVATERPAATDISPRVRFNVPNENGRELWEEMYDEKPLKDPYRYVYSVADPQPWETENTDDPASASVGMMEGLLDYFHRTKTPLINEFGVVLFDEEMVKWSGQVMYLSEPFDRTLEIPLMDERLYTIDVIKEIQQILKTEHPSWRTQLCGGEMDRSHDLMIYTDCVVSSVGQSPPEDLSKTVDDWQSMVGEFREKERGPRRRQEKHIVSLVKSRQLDPDRDLVVPLVVFDNWRGRFDPDEYNVVVLERSGIHLSSNNTARSADLNGQIERTGLREWETDKFPEYWINEYQVKRNPDEPVSLILKETDGERVWQFEIDPTDLISDETLKELYPDLR